jgi:hypothetical protein
LKKHKKDEGRIDYWWQAVCDGACMRRWLPKANWIQVICSWQEIEAVHRDSSSMCSARAHSYIDFMDSKRQTNVRRAWWKMCVWLVETSTQPHTIWITKKIKPDIAIYVIISKSRRLVLIF